MLKEVWVSAAGSTYRAARRRLHQRPDPLLLFRQLAGREPLDQDRRRLRLGGDRLALRHRRLLRPARAAPALVAIKYTKNPEEVAKVIEYLGSEPVVKEFTERTLFLPAHEGVIAKGGLELRQRRPERPAGAREVRRRLPARRPRRRAAAAVEMGQRLLRRARHPHQPGDGGRAAARRRLRPHGPGHRRRGGPGRASRSGRASRQARLGAAARRRRSAGSRAPPRPAAPRAAARGPGSAA